MNDFVVENTYRVKAVAEARQARETDIQAAIVTLKTALTKDATAITDERAELAEIDRALLEKENSLKANIEEIRQVPIEKYLSNDAYETRLVGFKTEWNRILTVAEFVEATQRASVIEEKNLAVLLFPSLASLLYPKQDSNNYVTQGANRGIASSTPHLDNHTPANPQTTTKYDLKNIFLYFENDKDSHKYCHIVRINDKPTQLVCPYCYANATANGHYFDGAAGFVAHVRRCPKKEGITRGMTDQAIFEKAEAVGCLREVDAADIKLIRAGEVPHKIRKTTPPGKSSKAGTNGKEASSLGKRDRSDNSPLRYPSPVAPTAKMTDDETSDDTGIMESEGSKKRARYDESSADLSGSLPRT